MATRILASWYVAFCPFRMSGLIMENRYLLGQDENYPAVNFDSKDSTSSINQVTILVLCYFVVRFL